MKRLVFTLGVLPMTLAAQSNLVISGFTPNGLLTWSNVIPNSTCRVEWASSPAGPWTNTWAHLNAIPTGTNTQLSAFVPMFYRVVMTVPSPAPTPTYTIGWAILQWPVSETISTNQPFTVYGRVYIAGLTDQSPLNDPAENVVADFGYGPDGSDPRVSSDWVWARGAPNPSYSEPNNNDEYMGTFSVPETGNYDFAVRFSGDGGTNWVYADTNGTSDGYQVSNAGELVVTQGSFRVTGAVATAATSVVVNFNATLDPASVMPDGTQFAFNGDLTASSAIVSGSQVTLTTSTQTSSQSYTVTVLTSVQDAGGHPLGGTHVASFTGF